MATTPAESKPKQPSRRGQQVRIGVAVLLTALLTVFALSNLNKVEVNWIFGTWETPLIIVILLCIALGFGLDRALVTRSRSRKAKRARRSATPAPTPPPQD
jgi:uncharacterized integral membrane protein